MRRRRRARTVEAEPAGAVGRVSEAAGQGSGGTGKHAHEAQVREDEPVGLADERALGGVSRLWPHGSARTREPAHAGRGRWSDRAERTSRRGERRRAKAGRPRVDELPAAASSGSSAIEQVASRGPHQPHARPRAHAQNPVSPPPSYVIAPLLLALLLLLLAPPLGSYSRHRSTCSSLIKPARLTHRHEHNPCTAPASPRRRQPGVDEERRGQDGLALVAVELRRGVQCVPLLHYCSLSAGADPLAPCPRQLPSRPRPPTTTVLLPRPTHRPPSLLCPPSSYFASSSTPSRQRPARRTRHAPRTCAPSPSSRATAPGGPRSSCGATSASRRTSTLGGSCARSCGGEGASGRAGSGSSGSAARRSTERGAATRCGAARASGARSRTCCACARTSRSCGCAG